MQNITIFQIMRRSKINVKVRNKRLPPTNIELSKIIENLKKKSILTNLILQFFMKLKVRNLFESVCKFHEFVPIKLKLFNCK